MIGFSMKKILLAGLLSFTTVATVHAAPIKVGVIYGGTATGTELAAQLNDDTHFDFTATTLNASAADTLAELSAFDAVIIGDSGNNNNGYTAAMFSALKGYMQNGGGIVSTGWFNFAADFMSGQKLLDANYVSPIDLTEGSYNFASNGAVVDIINAAHDITNGISDFAFTSNHIEFETQLDAGAIKLAGIVGISNANTVAYQDLVGRSVYLGGQYLANTGYNVSGLRSGVQDQLLEQAVAWAANGSRPEPIPEPAPLALLGLGLLGFGIARKRRS